MTISIPDFALVVLIGPTGAGKSTFAHRHFASSEVLSSDDCRALVADDPTSQDATEDAFDVLHYIAGKRLKNRRLTVVDATNVQAFAREPLLDLAREHHALPVAIVLDLPADVCRRRNEGRDDRDFGPHVIRNHRRDLKQSLGGLREEGFKQVHVLESPDEVNAVEIERRPLWCDRRDDHGPFDIIGDVHGCASELNSLLGKLGYERPDPNAPPHTPANAYHHPDGRTAVFVGDLVDRGPRNLDVLRTVKAMVDADTALCVPGNHDDRFQRALRGHDVEVAHGLEDTLAEVEALPEAERSAFTEEISEFLRGLVSHYVLDGGALVVAHAGMRASLQGRASEKVRDFALYGETTGETDEFGLPERHDWTRKYRGDATVVYGHTPVPDPEWVNGTINIDTGCVFGGRLTALRYPERDLVSVESEATYADPVRPFETADEDGEAAPAPNRGPAPDASLPLDDVQGKHIVDTRLQGRVTIHKENATAALETMSRYAVDPRWLIYLPPTMSPSDTSQVEGMLEHPAEAFSYYRHREVPAVMCQEKHMGSRAVAVVCRDAATARCRFGVTSGEAGVIYTRSGRRFFSDSDLETGMLDRLRDAMDATGLWGDLETDWACFDAELMPWSMKAEQLIRDQYAAVGAAARTALPAAVEALEQADRRSEGDASTLLSRFRDRAAHAESYAEAYRPYCWSVDDIEDLRFAPFHLMATEGAVHVDKTHDWHLNMMEQLTSAGDDVLFATETRIVDLSDPDSAGAATDWWRNLTGQGGEGMVVKPMDFVTEGPKGLVQPAVKCRGREYLRIIYGPEYTREENLDRLRKRGLGRKRSLARREFALGIEALERFVRREPLRRVHQCVFGVLALESEPVDPRL